jgi:arylsulfatase A
MILRFLLIVFLFPCLLSAQNRPNVILIFTDDQGSIDMNIYGSNDLITPHMDALARSGVRFTQFYAAAPVCSPSRAALLTARYPQRAGVPGNVSSAQGHAGMPTEQTTFAEMMKKGGYATAHIGKWHLGYTPETMPNGQGFDTSFGHMGGCIDNYSHFFYWNGPNRHDLWRDGEEIYHPGEFFPDMMVNEAEQFIKNHQNEPFFIYWAINTPHYPLQGKPEWLEKYKHLPSPRREYAAFVSTMDEKIGQLLNKLETLEMWDNTIVIFMSDHGHSTEERTFGGGGNAGPYRGAKFSLFEGGIRVPAIISWPGHLPENEIRNQLGVGIDWLPTVAELCQIDITDMNIDGESLVPVIQSKEAVSPHQTMYWQLGPQWAVREGNWKLIGNPEDTSHKGVLSEADSLFLVNLEEDVTEMQNKASQHAEVVTRLKQLYQQWVTNDFQ